MRSWLTTIAPIAVAIATAVIANIVFAARQTQPPIEIHPLEPVPTPTVVLYVDVEGAVASPGVYSLPVGARVFEAIDKAGGSMDEADTRELNLASKVTDGQKLLV